MVWGQGQKCPQSVPAVVFWKKARSRYTRLEKSWSRVRKMKRNLMKVKRPPRQPANSELGRNWGGDSKTHQGSMESPEPFRQSQRVSGVPRTHQMTPRYGQRPPNPPDDHQRWMGFCGGMWGPYLLAEARHMRPTAAVKAVRPSPWRRTSRALPVQ